MSAPVSPIVEWSFFGQLVPERTFVIVSVPKVQVSYPDYSLSINLNIHASQVVAQVQILSGSPNVFTLRNAVDFHCKAVGDLVGFKAGMSVGVDIISCTNSVGEWRVFGSEIPLLYNKKHRFESELPIDLINAILTNPAASMALADFREAIRLPVQTGFFCYRAIETMMQTMKSGPTDKDASAWMRLRSHLRIDKGAIDYIKAHADWARHGRPGSITDDERASIFVLVDELLERFLVYIVNGRVPLNDDYDIIMKREDDHVISITPATSSAR